MRRVTAIAVLVALVLLLAVLLLVHAEPARRSAPYLPREGLSSARVERLWWPEPAAPVPRAARPRTQHDPESTTF